jgi:hypothetical protein
MADAPNTNQDNTSKCLFEIQPARSLEVQGQRSARIGHVREKTGLLDILSSVSQMG